MFAFVKFEDVPSLCGLPCGGFTAEGAGSAVRGCWVSGYWASYTLIGTGRMRSTGMDKIDLNEMKEDWLAGNAVVAFVGALLLGQAWEVSEGTVQLFRILTVPSYTGLVLLTFIACLFCLSLALALASLVTPLQSWALSTTSVLFNGSLVGRVFVILSERGICVLSSTA